MAPHLQKVNPKNNCKGSAMKKLAILTGALICLLILNSLVAVAEAGTVQAQAVLKAKVESVRDGDTFTALIQTPLNGKVQRKIRLSDGVDCPEADQPWGKEATTRTTELVLGKKVLLIVHGQSWGRPTCRVMLPDGRDLGKLLVIEGHAWADPRYTKGPELKRLEQGARAARRGLWQADDPIEPWKWRKRKR